MNSTFRRIGAAALVVGALLIGSLTTASAAGLEGRGGPARSAGAGPASAPTTAIAAQSGPLSAEEVAALTDAIDEEYAAMNTYQAVIDQFGTALPFSRIVRSEQQHVSALARLFARYGLAVPANPGLSPVPAWTSLTGACQTGVAAEIADAALYDTLRPQVDNADVLRVFANLQAASLNSHLPAFEACN